MDIVMLCVIATLCGGKLQKITTESENRWFTNKDAALLKEVLPKFNQVLQLYLQGGPFQLEI
jgi:hypothetical protein